MTRDAYVDDAGQRWEVRYDQKYHYEEGPDGEAIERPSTIEDFRFRREGEEAWSELPPWADITEDAKTTLCFFEQDDDGEITGFWRVTSGRFEAEPAVAARPRIV